MYDAFSRMENLLGTKGVKRLGSAKIATKCRFNSYRTSC